MLQSNEQYVQIDKLKQLIEEIANEFSEVPEILERLKISLHMTRSAIKVLAEKKYSVSELFSFMCSSSDIETLKADIDLGMKAMGYIEKIDKFLRSEQLIRDRRVKVFQELPTRVQQVLLLRKSEKMPNKEIAKRLGITPQATSALFKKGQERMRAIT